MNFCPKADENIRNGMRYRSFICASRLTYGVLIDKTRLLVQFSIRLVEKPMTTIKRRKGKKKEKNSDSSVSLQNDSEVQKDRERSKNKEAIQKQIGQQNS